MSLEIELALELNRITRNLNLFLQYLIREKKYSLSAEQYWILRILGGDKGYTQQDLANISGKDRSGITRHIDNMEESGLVVRIADKEDRRINRVYLSKKGKDILKDLQKEIEPRMESMIRQDFSKDLDGFIGQLEQLNNRFSNLLGVK